MLAWNELRLFVEGAELGLQGHGRGLNQDGAVGEYNGRHAPHTLIELSYPLGSLRHFIDIDFSIGNSKIPKYSLGSPAVAAPGSRVHKDLTGIGKLGGRVIQWRCGHAADIPLQRFMTVRDKTHTT
jgi:hypothetical protein